MWTIEQIEDVLQTLSTLKGDKFNIPVELNPRLVSAIGRVSYKKGKRVVNEKMEFSTKFLSVMTDKQIRDVIIHEWCHYYLNKTTGEALGHNARFYALCSEMGATPERTMHVELKPEASFDTVYKYTFYCDECGKYLGGRARRSKETDELSTYRTNCCSSLIALRQNW